MKRKALLIGSLTVATLLTGSLAAEARGWSFAIGFGFGYPPYPPGYHYPHYSAFGYPANYPPYYLPAPVVNHYYVPNNYRVYRVYVPPYRYGNSHRLYRHHGVGRERVGYERNYGTYTPRRYMRR